MQYLFFFALSKSSAHICRDTADNSGYNSFIYRVVLNAFQKIFSCRCLELYTHRGNVAEYQIRRNKKQNKYRYFNDCFFIHCFSFK